MKTNHRISNSFNLLILFSIPLMVYSQSDGEPQTGPTKYISNLTPKCIDCLCHAASGCDMKLGCEIGYCGPYKISKLFWIDGGREVLPEDDVNRAGAFEDCALQLGCSKRIITNYIEKYARDCNNDGVTDCMDYVMINYNGGYQCSPPLNRNEGGRNFTGRFNRCYNI